MGLHLQDNTPGGNDGVFVNALEPGSTAEQAGLLRHGDQLVTLDGQNMETLDGQSIHDHLGAAPRPLALTFRRVELPGDLREALRVLHREIRGQRADLAAVIRALGSGGDTGSAKGALLDLEAGSAVLPGSSSSSSSFSSAPSSSSSSSSAARSSSSDEEHVGPGWRCGRFGLLEYADGRSAHSASLCNGNSRMGMGLVALNIFLTPFLLLAHSVRIYLWPCILAYVIESFAVCLDKCCHSCLLHKDKDFPADETSLGAIEAKESSIVWCRSEQLLGVEDDDDRKEETGEGKGKGQMTNSTMVSRGKGSNAKLFEDGVTPSDICQGALGDCWLLAALAILAECNGVIEGVFAQKSYSRRGKYTVKLYSGELKKWVSVTVDDQIPCRSIPGAAPPHDVETLFTKPRGSELWVVILEKAFAKAVGGYATLEGGHSLWALEALTGDKVLKYSRGEGEQGTWDALEMRHKEAMGGKGESLINPHNARFFPLGGDNAAFDDEQFFALLLDYDAAHCLLGASTKGKDDTRKEGRPGKDDENSGIVPGHACTSLRVLWLVCARVGVPRRLCNLQLCVLLYFKCWTHLLFS